MPQDAEDKSRFGGNVVTVQVGIQNSRVPFSIDRDLLSTSMYFNGIINGPQKEIKAEIPVDNVQPDIFRVYFTWLYTKKIFIPTTDDKYKSLHYLYLVADNLQDQSFGADVLNSIRSLAKETKSYPHNLAKMVYQSTVTSCPWRQLYIDLWLSSIREGNGTIHEDWVDVNEGPKRFFIDLLVRQSSVFSLEEGNGRGVRMR